jgi:hypothetical protein
LSLEIRSIRQVGPKVVSLYLRDLDFLYNLGLPFSYTQPVDTWGSQVLSRVGICSDEDSNTVKLDKLLTACEKANVDPKMVNAGAWYLGKNTFDILLGYILNDDGKRNSSLTLDLKH